MRARIALAIALTTAPAAMAQSPLPPLAWDFDGRAVVGDVHVMPVIVGDVALDSATTWVGADVPAARQPLRAHRHAMLEHVPQAVADALPGAINSAVGPSWGGEFLPGRYRWGARRRVSKQLGHYGLHHTLTDVASDADGAGTLFVWVESLDAGPLSAETFPGDIVDTTLGPVVVDHAEEPFRVTVTVGAALFASDGDVVVRYTDAFDSVLDSRGPDATGRDVARHLAQELALVWPSNPALRDRFAQTTSGDAL